jgi:Mal s 1 allergenic protein-like
MRHRNPNLAIAVIAGLLLFAVQSATFAQNATATKSAAPLMSILDRFTATDVPAMGPAEIEVPPRKWTNAPAPAGLPGKGLAQHAMLYVGEGYNKMFVVNQGKVVWTYSTGPGGEFDDVWMLSNGNILFSRQRYVAEVTPKKEVVWRYDAPTNTEIHCCQPIGLDKVLFIQNALPPKLMVVNIRTRAVEVQHDLPAKSVDDQKTVHAQFRRVRCTAQGTYLVPFLNMGKVVEYDKDFKEIWSYEIPSPWAAIRLKNGNTLITDEKDKLTREVNAKKETVWELKQEDVPEEYRFPTTQTCTRLASGNTIICSRGANGSGPQLVEVTPDKKVVWVLKDWENLGPATAVQILDDPGVPENPGESEH